MSFNAKPLYIPEFATTDYTDPGGRVNVTEPTTDEKEKGWQYLQKPGSNKMNWIHRGNYYWINYFNQFWNSSHQFLINAIDSEGGAGISVLDIMKVDIINEYTGSAGVTIEGITLLDGYVNEPLGIKVAPVAGTNLHIHQEDSAASVSHFTNSTTGATAADGLDIGLDASEQGRIWNYENTDIVIGTNNTEMLLIDNAGNIGIRNGIPLYIYSAGNDKYISLIHNDTNALISTNSGNIYTDKPFGIGVTPSNPLHVMSTTNPQVRIGYDAGSYATIGVADGGSLIIASGEATGEISFYPGATAPIVNIFSAGATAYLRILSADAGEYITIQHNGTNALIGTAGANAGNIVITNTTECTGADTGALQVDGGADFAKHVNMQTDLLVGTNIISTSGYLKSGKGRWPTNYIHETNDLGFIYDRLAPAIPNVNDLIVLHGVITSAADFYFLSYAIRASSTTITIYYARYGTFDIATATIATSTAGSYGISMSW
jgi:hypothetical protein